MNFSLVCLLTIITALPFGAAFLLAPELTSAQYGISGWNPGTLAVARLFGVALLFTSAAALAVRSTTDARIQTSMSTGFALVSAVGTAATLHDVSTGAVNAMGWSTVVLYGAFTAAWASVAFRKSA